MGQPLLGRKNADKKRVKIMPIIVTSEFPGSHLAMQKQEEIIKTTV